MAKEKKKKDKKKKDLGKKRDFIKQLKIAYRNLDNPKKFYTTILLPLIVMGVIVFITPFILGILIPIPLSLNPMTFIVGGIVPIVLGIFYPYITWKNKENDINGKMHFFITHLRVLAISDLAIKDIINILGGKKVYGALGDELRKISILSTQ